MTAATKGERTRGRIARASAELMNQRGYLSAPVAEIIEATGIQKGGLYRHFESKEALIYAAFDFAVAQVRERFMSALQGKISAPERLLAAGFGSSASHGRRSNSGAARASPMISASPRSRRLPSTRARS